MRFSLKAKISILVVLALTLGLVYGGVYLREKIDRNKAAARIVQSANLFQLASKAIHQIQVERGKTALYLNGTIQESELNEQRKVVDQSLSEMAVAEGAQKETPPHSFQDIRKLVSDKEPTAKILSLYTQNIVWLIEKQVDVSKSVSLDGIEKYLLSINMLELAKEYTGRLRANLTPLLQARQPLAMSQVTFIQDVYSRILANLNSPIIETSPAGKKDLSEFATISEWMQVNQAFENTVKEASTGNFSSDSQKFYGDITTVINHMSDIIVAELQFVAAESESIRATSIYEMWFTTVILAVGLTLVTVASLLLIKGITKPIDFAVSSLQSASESITTSSGQVAQASHQVSSGAVESASALEEIVASIEELNSIVKQNADRAAEAAGLSAQGSKSAEVGHHEMAVLIGAMKEIASSSRRIEEIINVIDDIAFQTNLLALNAAVEAARAGEQGKGFAVVAEAVRTLSMRSATAAKDISVLIKESVAQVDNGTKVASSSEVALNSIVDAIKKVAVLNDEIAAASSEQSAGIQQISKAMNELDSSTQSNASAAEEVSASADEMNGQIENIGTLVHSLQSLVKGAA